MSNTNTQINEANVINELMTAKYNELLNSSTVDQLMDMLTDEGHTLANVKEHELIVTSLKDDMEVYSKLLEMTTKRIVMAGIRQLPLLVLVNILAETLHGRKFSNRMRIAATIVRFLEVSDAFHIVVITNKDGHDERIITLGYTLSQATQIELSTKQYNRTLSEVPRTASGKTVGHNKKIKADNTHMLPLLDKLNSTGYTLDARVWEKFKYELAAYRFEDMEIQKTMVTEGDKLIGKVFYFSHKFGDDNGRIYCEGDLFTLHGGALNYVFKFADKRTPSTKGLARLRTKVAELESELDTLSFKERVEYYSLSLDLIDAEAGKPIGTILHVDAKLSGLQHQCIATRNKSEAVYCGLLSTLKDGYGHLKSKLSNGADLSRQQVKDAYNPYQYGAGRESTCEPVLETGGKLDFKEWEKAYQKSFPNAFKLRAFLLSTAKSYKADVFRYTTASGFNAVITALGTEIDYVVTCYGKLKYERKEIDAKHMGVKLVAAFSHMLDASALHYVASRANFDLHLIHDSFGAHPNDVDKVEYLYISALQEHLVRPILKDFISHIVGDKVAEVNVSRMLDNTLTPSDIVNGLY